MIILENSNRIIEETVLKLINNEKRESADVKFCDFDDVQFRILCEAASKNLVHISISLMCINELRAYGVDDVVSEVYGALVLPRPDDGYDFTLEVNLDALPEAPDTLCKKLSYLKGHILGAPLRTAFRALCGGGNAPAPFCIRYRYDSNMYVVPAADRVTVIFTVDFKEQTDAAIARVIMQEFLDSKRTVSNAPPFGFTKDPPLELASFQDIPSNNVGFASFGMTTRYIEGDKMEAAIRHLMLFRAYLVYHIKCTKSYLHTRMRLRVDSLLQVLNRAIPDRPSVAKTVSGKTFVRQDKK